MTVTSTTSRNDYIGSGSTGPYAYTFKIFAATQLIVYVTQVSTGITATLNYLSDYTVSGAGNEAGGTITLSDALAVGYDMSIQRNVPLTQLYDFRNQAEFFPATYESALDYLMMAIQYLGNLDGSEVQLAPTTSPLLFSPILPANLLPGNAIVVNATGTGFSMAALSAATLSAWNASNAIFLDAFTSGFTPGTTTQLTLSHSPGAAQNLTVSMRISGLVRLFEHDEYSVSGTTLTFGSAIPSGTTRIEVAYLLTYQVNTVTAPNIVYQPASGPSTDGQTELRALDASVVTINTNVTKLQGEVLGLHLADFGVVGNGTTDDTTAFQAALTAGASQQLVVYGHAMVVKITSAVTMAGPGLVFDYAGQGTAGTPGILVSGTGYTALTVSGSPQFMNVCVYGTGNAANGIYFNNPVRAICLNTRVYNLAGFGVRIDKMYDCLFGSISVESIDASTSAYGAFSINDGGDTSNQSHILRLQAENCTGNVINISPNSLDCVIDTIHSEGAVATAFAATALVATVQYQIVTVGTTDFTAIGAASNTVGLTFQASGAGTGTGTASAITWILGGASSVFNEARFNKASGTAKLWLRGAYSTYLSMRAESGINVDLEGTSSTGLVLVSPNFNATTREFPSQGGQLVVQGGTIGTWSGNRSNLYGQFNPDGGNMRLNGNLTLGTNGNEIAIKQGTAGSCGRAVLVAGTVTVATTLATTTMEVELTYRGVANTAHLGILYVGNIVGGTSFVINSTNGADDSNVSWQITERA